MGDKAKKEMYDIPNESLVVGSFYKQPDLFLEYGTLMRSKYDFFDDGTKFLYNCFETYYTTYSQEISEDKLNVFMSKTDERHKRFIGLGGWDTIEELMNLSDASDFKNYYSTLKKYSFIREFDKKGFPAEKLMNHPKFEKMNAEQIVKIMRNTVDKVHTVIGGLEDSSIIGKSMTEQVKKWREKPAIGIPFPFDMWTYLFRGWRKGKLIVDGMLSNEGKSRKMSFVAAYTSLVLDEPILIMVNEMSEEDITAAMLTTVCNSPEFGFELGVPERNIVLNEYENEEQFEKVMEVAKYFEENTKIYFREMSDYSDDEIEHQCKKHVLGKGVTSIFYDTLKGYNTDQWDRLKQTTTKLKDMCSELKIRGYATIQLTDDSLYLPVHEFSSNNIANAKQLKHVVDFLILEKKLYPDEYDKYEIYNEEWGGEMPLERNKVYYGQKIDKNRAGGKGMVLCTEVNLDTNVWTEVGTLERVRKK